MGASRFYSIDCLTEQAQQAKASYHQEAAVIEHPPRAGRPGLTQLSQEAAISILRGQHTEGETLF